MRQLTEARDQNFILEYYPSSVNKKLTYVTFDINTDPVVVNRLKTHLETEYGAKCAIAPGYYSSFVLTIRL